MWRSSSLRHAAVLPEGVVLSVQGISRAQSPPEAELPRWLARLLPKSGIAGQFGAVDTGIEEDEEEEDDEEEEFDLHSALSEVSFDVRTGQGLGLAGPDRTATMTLLRILTRAIPPSSGRIVARGRVASLAKQDLLRYIGFESGMDAVFLIARYLHWPRALLRARQKEILEFARLEELEGLAPRPYRNKTTMRLLFSAALHMDATVYVLDEGIPSDDHYGARCLDLLAERQHDGAVVIQRTQTRVENVARLCNEVLWFENGTVRFRGRPLDVAIAAEKAQKEELHPLSAPILASLSDSRDFAEVAAEGGTIEIELHILRKNLDLGFTLVLTDDRGHEMRLDSPDRFRSEAAGLHRLRIRFPGGLLRDSVYDTKLLADVGVPGSKPTPPREILAFELVSEGSDEIVSETDDIVFEFLPDWDDVPGTEEDVEWDVGRASA
jgi:ABC-type polysaccharide/polyol phosphate transport system ATPase subunit